MRRRLREAAIEVRVVKNTLLRLAANESGQPDLLEIIEGPTALAISYGDAIGAAKALSGYAQGAPAGFALRGGFMDGRVLSAQDLRDLVRVPPKPVLLAQFMGRIQSPLAGFIGLLDAPLRDLSMLVQSLLAELPGLIEARARQMEESGIGTQAEETPALEAEEPAAEEPAAEEAGAEEAAAEEAATEAPAEGPAEEQDAEASAEEPLPAEESPAEVPTAELTSAEEPVAEGTGAEEPAAEETVAGSEEA